ncbi:putative WRKY transcription factor 70, partial [Bienertia sinuspersici]
MVTPKSSQSEVVMNNIIKLLKNGQESANHLRILFNQRLGFKVDDHHQHHAFDHHSLVILNSFESCISMLKSCDFDQLEIDTIKRKVDQTNDEDHHSTKCEEIVEGQLPKERRGCYKRRRNYQPRSFETTTLTDDGYAWRKYGQKQILNAHYPRNYYRCTHKIDQNCQATKQVQQISSNPTKYNIIYNGQHTCKNLHENPPIIIDDDSSVDENPSCFFIFDSSNNHPTSKHALNPS